MKKMLVALVAITLIMFSGCEDPVDEMTIHLDMSGGLAFVLQDSDGNPIPEKDIRLYSYSVYEDNLVDVLTTDANGKVNFGSLAMGDYVVTAKAIEVNGVEYYIEKTVQVLANENKNVVLNPEDFVGKVSITFVDKEKNPLYGIGVILIEMTNYQYDSINDVESLIIQNETSNSSGIVVIDSIPMGKYYELYWYMPGSEELKYEGEFRMSYKGDYELEIEIVYRDVTVYVQDWRNDEPVHGAEVLLLHGYVYPYGSSADLLRSIAIKDGLTNENGLYTFEDVLAGEEYTIVWLDGSYVEDYTSFYLSKNYINPFNAYLENKK